MLGLRIPIDAVITMGTKTMADVYSQLLSTQSAALIDVLTFGYINTPINRNATCALVAYVTYWAITNVVTVCRVEDGQCHLLGSLPWDGVNHPTPKECEALFLRYWKEGEHVLESIQ